MPTYVKVLTVLVTLPAWLAVVIDSLVRGQIPSPALMAVPAGVIVATSGFDVLRIVRRVLDATEPSDDTSKENGKP